MDTLWHGKTIGGLLLPKLQTGVYGYFVRQLRAMNMRGVRLVRESVVAADGEAHDDVMRRKSDAEGHICAVPKRLVAERDNPVHYGDNKPGWFDSDGNALTPARFSYSDLISYGPSGEGGVKEFLSICEMPEGTTYDHLDLAVILLTAHEALQFSETDLPYAFHLLDEGKSLADEIEIYRARKRLEKEVPEKVLEQAFSELQSTRAKARYAQDKSGKQKAKAEAREWWQRWQAEPSLYKSAAAFARAMLDKYPDHLTSQPVVEQWVREWKAGGEKP